ncbi:fibronectin type III domain-containing protein [bacterium]|nr:fibronectin type III domain-containing protein [bacterium]
MQPAQEAIPQQFRGATLPALDSQDIAGDRSTSITGPGYRRIDLLQDLDALNLAVIPGGKRAASGIGPYAYGLYGLRDFPVGTYPTDLKVQVEGSGEPYYVAFANYESRRWIFSGPFTASAQDEIPFAGNPGGLHDYISSSRQARFMVLSPEGSLLVLSGLEIGVNGGEDAPFPPSGLETDGGSSGLLLRWEHSASYFDADFAGYILERAPHFGGDFVALTPVDFFQNNWLDEDLLGGSLYRYRVCSVDTSGNRAYTTSALDGLDPMSDTPPVLRVNFNAGPFEGATEVSFDFTGSYDPDGTALTACIVSSYGGQDLANSPDLIQTAKLHPGCYQLELTVESNGKSTECNLPVKVFPRWESAPITVSGAQPGGWSRLFASRMRYMPDNQRVALFGHDAVSNAMVIYTGLPGGTLTPHRIWSIQTPETVEEPINYQGSMVMPLAAVNQLLIITWNEDQGITVPFGGGVACSCTGLSRGSAVTDGSSLYMVTMRENVGTYDVTVSRLLGGIGVEEVPVVGLPGSEAVAAVYNAGANAIDIVFGDTMSLQWRRWSLDSNSVVGSGALAGSSSDCIDLEINPATGEPAVAYIFGGRIRYREYDGLAWSVEELMDNTVANFAPFDLRFAHGTRYIYASVDTGYSALYEHDGSFWQQRNTPAELGTGGKDTTIIHGAEPGQIYALDRDAGNNVRLMDLRPGDNSSVLKAFDARPANGMQLRGAAGSDGLHVVYLDRLGAPRHYLGNNNGTGWTDMPLPWAFMSSIDIAAQSGGEVYFSINNPNALGTIQLDFWDPMTNNLSNEVAPIAHPSVQFPFLGGISLSDTVTWSYFDEVAGTIENREVNQTNGVISSSDMIGMDKVWAGANTSGSNSHQILLRGGANPWQSSPCLHKRGDDFVDELYDIVFSSGPPFDLLTSQDTAGRVMDGAVYLRKVDLGLFGSVLPSEIFAIAQGPFLNVATVEADILGQLSLEFKDNENPFTSFFSQDLRRTVSVTDTPGLSAAMLISPLGGADPYFAWSNFGEWEKLPLPDGLSTMNRPELLVGMDGRWHIIYHDWLTDEIKCLTTTE